MTDLDIGTLPDGTPVGLDPDDTRYRDEGIRIGLFASSGAGKGYLAGVLIEELIAHGYPVIMIDPESELWTFRELGALVIGGPHGHVPFDPAVPAAIEDAIAFCRETATPLIFDLDGMGDVEIREAFEAIAAPYWRSINADRSPSVLAMTEAHLVAPQTLPRGVAASTALSRIFSGGRKRGAITLVETQRIADIANNVIAHCNLRFIGRIDFEDDFKRVAKGLRGVDFASIQALERGTFYAPRLADLPIRVRQRRVTHGGGTPGGGGVTLRKDVTPRALSEMTTRLRNLSQSAPAGGTSDSARTPAAAGQRRGRREARLERPNDAPAGLAHDLEAARAELATEREKSEHLREHMQDALDRTARDFTQAVGERDEYRLRLEQCEEQLRAWFTLRDVLAAAVASALGDGAIPPDSYTGRGSGLTEDQVVALIAKHAPAAGQVAALAPVEALRKGYLERSAERLVDRARAIDTTEREVLLFLLAHPTQQTTTSVSKALTGQNGGAGYQRISDALRALAAAGLAESYKSGNNRPWRPAVEKAVRSELSPHGPTDDEVQAVINRALYVLQKGG